MIRLLKNKFFWMVIVFFGLLIRFFPLKSISSKDNLQKFGVAKRQDVVQRVTASGNVVPNRKGYIAAPYNAYVKKIYVKIGDYIRAGDPVVSLQQSLQSNADDVYPMRAPFTGTVVHIANTEGEYVEQQTAQNGGNFLVRIDDLSQFAIDASVPEVEVIKLKIGQEVVIKAPALLNKSYRGKIKTISLSAKEQKDWDRSRVEFPFKIEILNKDGDLRSGMSVVVDIIVNKVSNVIALEHEFIQKENEKCFITDSNGVKKQVVIGLQNEEVIEIKDGLQEGDRARQIDFLSLIKN